MNANDRYKVIDELGWHCDDPRAAFELLEPAEARDILKRGFVTKDLSESIAERLERRCSLDWDPSVDRR